MSEITLKAIADLIHAEFEQELEPVKAELKAVRETLNTHSGILDEILKNTNDWRIEMKVMRDRLDRYEKVIKIMAQKLNVDVEPILH